MFYRGYKNHVLVDCITGLPIFELTTTADVSDSTVALNILSQTNSFLPINECTFIADKAYDVKEIYNTVKNVYSGDCAIPLNKRNTKKETLYALRGNIYDINGDVLAQTITDKQYAKDEYCILKIDLRKSKFEMPIYKDTVSKSKYAVYTIYPIYAKCIIKVYNSLDEI